MESPATVRTEVLVVGSGPGGAITACLLAEAGLDVVMLEEGPNLPLSSCTPFSLEEMVQKYRNGGLTPTFGKPKVAYVEGRCVGGGSEINSGLYHRTPPEILDQWQTEFQLHGATESEMDPHFAAIERDLSVSPRPYPGPLAGEKFAQAAEGMGWKTVEAPRWFSYAPDAASPTGFAARRRSMTETFIPRFLASGGRIFPDMRAHRLIRNGSRWTLGAVNRAGERREFVAENLFLCAGAIQSAAILRRSGITQNVGNSLQLHPTLKIAAQFRESLRSDGLEVVVHQVKEFSPRLSFGCSISSLPHLALGLLDSPIDRASLPEFADRMALYYVMITSPAHGRIRPIPGFKDPFVQYRLGENDLRNFSDGIRKLAHLLFAAGVETIFPNLPGSPTLYSDDDLNQIPAMLDPRSANLMTIHLFSSCPMGENQELCATDSFGRVHGFRNLYINDASLLCTAPGVNPQGSVMAFARRNALNFLAGRSKRISPRPLRPH